MQELAAFIVLALCLVPSIQGMAVTTRPISATRICTPLLLLALAFGQLTLGHLMSTTVTKGLIVGGGRIGSLLYDLNDKQDVFNNKRTDTVAEGSGPIYVCTRNADLENIIETCPESRREDLVFLQNGVLTKYLETKGLADNTQGLIYFAVSKKGEAAIDGITDLNPDGLTAVTGKWASDFAARLQKGNLKCHILDKPAWTVAMLEKHIWICAFMAVGAKHGGCTVGEVEGKHNAEVRALIAELGRAAAEESRVAFPAGVADRLCAYARSVSHFPTALKEFEWRNGWFTDVTFKAVTRMLPDPCPLHSEIMTDQKLFFSARKSWTRRKAAECEAAYGVRQEKRERAQYLSGLRKEQRAQPEFLPLIRSPTILLKNRTPRVEKLIAQHEATQRSLIEQERADEEARIDAVNSGANIRLE